MVGDEEDKKVFLASDVIFDLGRQEYVDYGSGNAHHQLSPTYTTTITNNNNNIPITMNTISESFNPLYFVPTRHVVPNHFG